MLKIEIITPIGLSWIISGESISLPGVVGRFQILSKHLPILSNLSEGQIVIKGISSATKKNIDDLESLSITEASFHIVDGFIDMKKDVVTVLGNVDFVN